MAAVTTATKITRGEKEWHLKQNDEVQEIVDAKGAYATLKARVDALTQAPSDQWVDPAQTPTFVSTTQFTVPTDLTTKFEPGRRVKVELLAGTLRYSRVTSSSFAASTTTVNIQDAILTADLSKAWYSFWDAGEDASVWSGQMADLAVFDRTTGNLVIDYNGGRVVSGTTVTDVSSGTLTLTASQTNYVEVDPTTGTVSSNTTGFTSGQIPLAQVVTGVSSVTSITDKRGWVANTYGEIDSIAIESVFRDTTNFPAEALAGYTPVLDFSPTTAQYVYFVLDIPERMDVTKTSKLVVRGTMSTSEAANVVLAGNRVEYKDAELVTGTGTAFTVTVTPDATLGNRKTHDIVTFAANIFEQSDSVTFRFYRDAANAADTHGGNFRHVTLKLQFTTRRGAAT